TNIGYLAQFCRLGSADYRYCTWSHLMSLRRLEVGQSNTISQTFKRHSQGHI
ncbi:MAG: hypothetical protein ACI90G_002030, partial [Urechidicola sp.]